MEGYWFKGLIVIFASLGAAASPLPAAVAAVNDPLSVAQCELKQGVVIGAGYFKKSQEQDAGACCNACFSTQGCLGFTFDTSGTRDCFLKDNVFNTTAVASRVSGTFESRTVATRACSLPGHTSYPFCNTSLAIDARVQDLISRLTAAEKAPLLTASGTL